MGIAYILNYGVIRDAGATIVSAVSYISALFATMEGVVVLREPLT